MLALKESAVIVLVMDIRKGVTNLDEDIVKYDILLTETFEKLANHLHKGKLNPKELYTDWDLKPKEIALSPLLEKGINSLFFYYK